LSWSSYRLIRNAHIGQNADSASSLGDRRCLLQEIVFALFGSPSLARFFPFLARKVSQLSRVLHPKFDKNLSSQKIQNLIRKLTSTFHNDDASCLQNFYRESGNTTLAPFVLCSPRIHQRYYMSTHTSISKSTPSFQISKEDADVADVDLSSPYGCAPKTMSTREKYNLISPVMMNIVSLVSCHGTEQFRSYLATMIEDGELDQVRLQYFLHSAGRNEFRSSAR